MQLEAQIEELNAQLLSKETQINNQSHLVQKITVQIKDLKHNPEQVSQFLQSHLCNDLLQNEQTKI